MKTFSIFTRFLAGVLLLFFATSVYADSNSCLGKKIASIDGASSDTQATILDKSIDKNKSYYYYFKPAVAGTITVTSTSTDDSNKLDLYLYTTCGGTALTSDTSSNTNKSITYDIPVNTTVAIQIKNTSSSDSHTADLKFTFTANVTLPTVNTANDLCYDTPQPSGFCNPLFSMNCTITTPIKSISSTDSLTQVQVAVGTSSVFSAFTECGVDKVSGNCKNASGMSFMSFSSFTNGIDYTLPTYTSLASHKVYNSAGFNFLTSSYDYVGTYVKNGIKHQGVISSCSAIPTLGFDKDTYNISENTNLADYQSSPMILTIQLSKALDHDVTVHYKTRDGKAIGTGSGGTDYVSIEGDATIPKGQTTFPLQVNIIHDPAIELDEDFYVDLSNINPADSAVFGISTAKIIILEQTTSPVCYQDDFSGTLNSDWRLLYSKNGTGGASFTPIIDNGRLEMTPAQNQISTAVTRDYEFPAKENLIVVVFDQYAYGPQQDGSTYGADGIGVVLYDSAVGANPIPGAFGGSLGYAQKLKSKSDAVTDLNGFQGGWLGLGLDEYGNYANPTEGRDGGIGFEPNAVSIRGSGSGTNGYSYLNGTQSLTPALAKTSSSSQVYSGGRFRMTIDSRDPAHLYITLERDPTGTGNSYATIINKFDAIASQGNTPDYVRLAITASTGGYYNIHELDNISVSGTCRAYSPNPPPDVVSIADIVNNFISPESYNSGTKYITTKIVNKTEQITGVYLNSLGQAATYSGTNGLAFRIIPYLSYTSNPSAKEIVYDTSGNPAVITITNGQVTGNMNVVMPAKANKDAYFIITALDFSQVYNNSPDQCLISSSTTGNLQGLGQCINGNSDKYTQIFGASTSARCHTDGVNGNPCSSSNHGQSCGGGSGLTDAEKASCGYNAQYDTDYGCLMCTLDSNQGNSSDHFAIRPYAFKVFGQNQYKRAGEDFNLTIKALDTTQANITTGLASDVTGVVDYNESLNSLNLTAVALNETNSSISTSCPHAGTFTLANPTDHFTNGEINASTSYSETGIINIGVSEKPGSEFALVDADDTPDIDRYITPSSIVYNIDDINQTTLSAFIPYTIQTDANVSSSGNKDWLYMYNPATPADLLNMSAQVNYHITAKNKQGDTTQNFTKTCFFNTSAPTINGMKKNTTFDMFLDFRLQGSNPVDTNLTFYVKDDMTNNAIWMPSLTADLNNTAQSYRQFVFPDNFLNGESNTSVHFNITRRVNESINPIKVTFLDANTSTSWMANPGATNNFVGTTFANKSKNFLYGRTHAQRYRFTGNNGVANIYYEAYCDKDGNKSMLPTGSIGSSDSIGWYLNPAHNATTDGSITDINASLVSHSTPSNISGGISTTLTYDGTKGYPYKTTMLVTPSPWLIYDPYNATATTNDFEVEFYGGSNSWTGHKNNTTTTDSVVAPVTSKRILW